ncbi:AhpC-TSA-domain-containing protein [Cercophora samala]|uniref:thioredoxin-dependent peroxiredoxin n=1 Tax=Cercophora samala TaxID=330535 RepID=A0AA39ZIU7_9PEZI|nr:AhpC-TSA-domain-containing protein [Cercophora samala]
MPVELRKRKAPPPPPEPPAKKTTTTKKAAAPKKTAAAKVKDAVKETVTKVAEAATFTNGAAAAAASAEKPSVGDVITLDGFGGEITLQTGDSTTLSALVEKSKKGVVLFTYPKASTPGCTRQACMFRDEYTALATDSGFDIYGLSTDSPKANTTFKEKQKLPYELLCDPGATLIGAIGLKKAPKGTTRGVFVVDKSGKVLAAQAGSPEGTVNVVREIVAGLGEENGEEKKEEEEEKKTEEEKVVEEEKKEEEKKEEEKKEEEKKEEEKKEEGKVEEKKEEAEEEKKKEEAEEEKKE